MKPDIIRRRPRRPARSSQSGLDDLPASPDFSHRTSSVRDTSPTLAPDDAMKFRSTSFELVGALRNPATNGNS